MGAKISRKFRLTARQILEVEALDWDYIPKGKNYVYNITLSCEDEMAEYAIHKSKSKDQARDFIDFLKLKKYDIMFRSKIIKFGDYELGMEIIATPEFINHIRNKN